MLVGTELSQFEARPAVMSVCASRGPRGELEAYGGAAVEKDVWDSGCLRLLCSSSGKVQPKTTRDNIGSVSTETTPNTSSSSPLYTASTWSSALALTTSFTTPFTRAAPVHSVTTLECLPRPVPRQAGTANRAAVQRQAQTLAYHHGRLKPGHRAGQPTIRPRRPVACHPLLWYLYQLGLCIDSGRGETPHIKPPASCAAHNCWI